MLHELLNAAKWVLGIGGVLTLIVAGLVLCVGAATDYPARPLRAVAGAALSVVTIIFAVAWVNHDEKIHPERWQRHYTVTTTTDEPQ